MSRLNLSALVMLLLVLINCATSSQWGLGPNARRLDAGGLSSVVTSSDVVGSLGHKEGKCESGMGMLEVLS